MEFTINVQPPEKIPATSFVLPVFADEPTPLTKRLDKLTQGKLTALLNEETDLDKAGSLHTYTTLPGLEAERVHVVSLGPRAKLDRRAWMKAVRAAAAALANGPGGTAVVPLAELKVPGTTLAERLRRLATTLEDATYRYEATKTTNGKKPRGAERIELPLSAPLAPDELAALEEGRAIAAGMARARELGNLPPNLCTPAKLAETALELGKAYELKVQVLEREDAERLGMGAFLAVAAGSKTPPKFIVAEYRGSGEKRGKRRPIVLIGKGITFDSGGICLKPAAQMDEMKFDMCGAAAVLGTLEAVARLKLPLDVVAIVPATENLPSGTATRPGDVVRTLAGRTVEILNTDAEGRLILCDALTYAQREYRPECLIDVATLTGAIVIALGKEATGLMSNDETLAQALLESGERAADPAWQLPLWEEYQEALKSNFADVANVSTDRAAGSITAACFLALFVEDVPWAHLDIAGTAWRSGEKKGATGRPVPLLVEFLLERAAARRHAD